MVIGTVQTVKIKLNDIQIVKLDPPTVTVCGPFPSKSWKVNAQAKNGQVQKYTYLQSMSRFQGVHLYMYLISVTSKLYNFRSITKLLKTCWEVVKKFNGLENNQSSRSLVRRERYASMYKVYEIVHVFGSSLLYKEFQYLHLRPWLVCNKQKDKEVLEAPN